MQLRRLCEKDAPLMLEWMRDPAVISGFRMRKERMTQRAVLDFIASSQQEEDNLHLACVDADDTYLGTISLKNIDRVNQNAELAIAFRSCAHGTGAAQYAMRRMQQIAFEEMGLNRLFLYVLSQNARAIAFYRKTGFQKEGTMRRHLLIDGAYCDWEIFGLLREEYDVYVG